MKDTSQPAGPDFPNAGFTRGIVNRTGSDICDKQLTDAHLRQGHSVVNEDAVPQPVQNPDDWWMYY